ncbi:MAG TPA: hypothetical protein VGH28_16515 [Polyangiaceae bacterium]
MNKSNRIQRNQNISKALRTSCKNSIPVNGKLVKPGDLAKLFDESTAAETEVIQSRARYIAAVAAQREAEAKVKPLIQPIKGFVQNTFGAQSEISASFGFSPRKTGHVDAEKRAEAVLKLRATRAARGTKGSRQKAAIHGSIETPAPAPVVATPAPSQPAVTTPVVTNGTNGAAAPSVLSLNGLDGSAH